MNWSLLNRDMTSWNPFDDLLGSSWRDPFYPFVYRSGPRPRWSNPPLNVYQGQDDVVVTCEVPGVEPDDLNISVEADTVKLSGKRRAAELSEGERFHRRERGAGEFSRVLTLPFRLEPKSVEATYERGVLRVRAERAAEDRPRRIEVKSA
jgi:HSP20 family protein